MIFKSKTIKPWLRRDYAKTIIHFIAHAIIIACIYLFAIFLNNGKMSGLTQFFANTETRMKFIYLMVSTLFLLSMLYLYLFFEYRDFLRENKNILLIFVIIEVSLLLNFFIGKLRNAESLVQLSCKFLCKGLDDVNEVYPLDIIHSICGHGQLGTDGTATNDCNAHVR